MKASLRFRPLLTSLALSALLLHGQMARGAAAVLPPDLTAAGVIPKIDRAAGTGLKGEYYGDANLTKRKLTRLDTEVAFDWGAAAPDASLGTDNFSVRWSGQLLVPETGSYTFSTLTSGGVRLIVNGVPVIDKFSSQETKWNDGSPILLKAGQGVKLQMEYSKNTGAAAAKLKWTGPSFAGRNGATIAKEWLYGGTGVTNRTR